MNPFYDSFVRWQFWTLYRQVGGGTGGGAWVLMWHLVWCRFRGSINLDVLDRWGVGAVC